MASIIVKDVSGLTAALKSAQAGDTIKLAAGDYGAFTLSDMKFAGAGVTVTSLDPSNMASLHGFQLRGCEGIRFSNLELEVDPTQLNAYQIVNSTNISIDKVNVHGTLDGNAQNDGSGFLIRHSDKVSVTNSEFHELKGGIGHSDSKNVVIQGNTFHDIQTDGVFGGGTSQITISNNLFRDFYPKDRDHPDAIQFWTTNTTASASDITITGNVVLRGEGSAIQGIFFRDQVGSLPFKNVVISDNFVLGGGVNGIRINGAENLTITDNVVSGLADQRSAITIDNTTGVTLTNNTATQFVFEAVTNVVNTGSVVIAIPSDGGKSLLETYLTGSDAHTMVASSTFYMDATTSALAVIEVQRAAALTVSGTAAADSLSVDAKRDTQINAGAGDDLLTGGGVGHNTLSGEAGNDSYRVNSTFDVVVEAAGGGVDNVVASVSHELAANVEDLRLVGEAYEGIGNDLDNKISGAAGDQALYGMGGNDAITAGDGNDFGWGGIGNDTVLGGNGADSVHGDAGADAVRGGAGNDSVSGGAGIDTLTGGEGADALSGGAGADIFMFSDGDIAKGEVILDFSRLDGDKINLQPIDADTVLTRNQTFDFIGTSGFTKVAGQLRYEVSGLDSYVSGDVNGDGVADFQMLIKGVSSVTASDFIL